jgi:hypothetical protein
VDWVAKKEKKAVSKKKFFETAFRDFEIRN